MNSKFIVLALITLIISSFAATAIIHTAKAQTTTVTLIPSLTQISQSDVGSTLQVNISVANVANLWQWSVNVTWDPAVFNLTQIKEGPFLKGPSNTITTMFNVPLAKDIHAGALPDMVCTSTATDFSSVSGSGVLATLTFKILSAHSSQIKLGHSELNRIDLNIGNTVQIPHTFTDLQIPAVQATPTPSPTTNSTSIPTSTPTSTPSTNATTTLPTPTNSPATSPSATQSLTSYPTSSDSNPTNQDMTTVYFILVAGIVMAVLVALAVFFKK